MHPVRQRPKGEVETFSGKLGKEADLEPVAITTEDYGAILLRFEGGRAGRSWVSQVTAGRKNCLRYEMAGEKGALAWNSENPEELWIGRRGGPNELLMRDPSILSGPRARRWAVPGGHNEGYPDTFKQCFRAFYGYIAKGDFSAPPPFATFADGHREVVLCEAILESHRKGGWVKVEEVDVMKLGFVTAILPDLALEEVLAFATAEGFECVELMCWPKGKAERRYAGVTHVDVDDARRGGRRPGAQAARRARRRDQRPRLLPEPARSRPGRGAGLRRPPEGRHPGGAAPRRGPRQHVRRPRLDEDGGRELAALPRDVAAAGGVRRGPRRAGSASRTARCSSPATSGPAARTSPRARRSGGGCSPTSRARASASTSTRRTSSGSTWTT